MTAKKAKRRILTVRVPTTKQAKKQKKSLTSEGKNQPPVKRQWTGQRKTNAKKFERDSTVPSKTK